MKASNETILSDYRPKKGLAQRIAHPVLGELDLRSLTASQIQEMEKEGLLIRIKRRVKS